MAAKKRPALICIYCIALFMLIVARPGGNRKAPEKSRVTMVVESARVSTNQTGLLHKVSRIDTGQLLMSPGIRRPVRIEVLLKNPTRTPANLVLKRMSCSCMSVDKQIFLDRNETRKFEFEMRLNGVIGKFSYKLQYEDVDSSKATIIQLAGEVVPTVLPENHDHPESRNAGVITKSSAFQVNVDKTALLAGEVSIPGVFYTALNTPNQSGDFGIMSDIPLLSVFATRTTKENVFGPLLSTRKIDLGLRLKDNSQLLDFFGSSEEKISGFISVFDADEHVRFPIIIHFRKSIDVRPENGLFISTENNLYSSAMLRISANSVVSVPEFEPDRLFSIVRQKSSTDDYVFKVSLREKTGRKGKRTILAKAGKGAIPIDVYVN